MAKTVVKKLKKGGIYPRHLLAGFFIRYAKPGLYKEIGERILLKKNCKIIIQSTK